MFFHSGTSCIFWVVYCLYQEAGGPEFRRGSIYTAGVREVTLRPIDGKVGYGTGRIYRLRTVTVE